jgi:alpha-methylacyl-CoA racemase
MGPLAGLKIVEIAGIGPGPFAAMLLSDMGADVIRVDRPGSRMTEQVAKAQLLNRGRPSAAVDLKSPRGVEVVLRLVEQADGLIEGFRPGVMERLGLGPDVCLARNERLVYGRMTGWGQDGPLAPTAGHDIDYIAVSGALGAMAREGEAPLPPLNLVGDFGGGGMVMAFGMMCGVFEAQRSGRGQVIDAAMVDGASLMMSMFWGMRSLGAWSDRAGTNILDSGAHFYNVYETADGRHIAVGAIEPQFYAELVRGLGFAADELPPQNDKSQWPAMKEKFARRVKEKSMDDWIAIFDGTDACVAPVRRFDDALTDPHNVARNAFVRVDDIVQPAPVPRFSRTVASIRRGADVPGGSTDEALAAWGFSSSEIDALRTDGAVA